MCSYRQKTSIIYSFSKIVHFGTGQNRLLSSKATIIVKSVYFYRLSFPFSLTQINDFDDNVQLFIKRIMNTRLLRFEHYRQYCRLSSKATIIVKSVYFYRLSFPFSLTQINDFDDNVQLFIKRIMNTRLLRFEHYRQYCRLASKATIIVKSVYFYRLSFPL